MDGLPEHISNNDELDELLARPSDRVCDLFSTLQGDLIILGVAGKMGTTLAWMARRAAEKVGNKLRIIGVSRFSNASRRDWLEERGVETISCDLLDRAAVDALPEAANVIYMAGRKFGTVGAEAATWASNVVIPTRVCDRYAKSAIVAFSTGCVYPVVPSNSGGCSEATTPEPIGDYAQSCLGRERVFQHFSQSAGLRACLLRLNYAIDLRYGVLHDIATKVWEGEEVGLSAPNANIIWQGDANAQTLLALQHCQSPANILNITGPETLSVEAVARFFAARFNKPVRFSSVGPTSYLNNAGRATALFGYPSVSPQRMMEWTADWIVSGGGSLGAPTHFEVQSGVY